MLKKLALTAYMATALAGCAMPQQKPISLRAPFNVGEAAALTKPGVNIVSGSALIRQNGGGVVTCAGLPIVLVPQTAYATERVKAIYGNTTRGYNPITRRLVFTPDPSTYMQMTRETLCDAQGNFTFPDVADGSFYVISVINWTVANSPQGGSLMQFVSVSGGQSQQVVLSP